MFLLRQVGGGREHVPGQRLLASPGHAAGLKPGIHRLGPGPGSGRKPVTIRFLIASMLPETGRPGC
jgi:hypothetical protein